MAKRIKKKCILCGTEYEIWCPTCKEALSQPIWKNEFHDKNCLDIYQICSNYNMKKISVKNAKIKLDKCDLSKKDDFTLNTQKIIKEILDKSKIHKQKQTKRIKDKKDSD